MSFFYWGAQAWTQQSRCDLTSAYLGWRMTSLTLLATLFLMQMYVHCKWSVTQSSFTEDKSSYTLPYWSQGPGILAGWLSVKTEAKRALGTSAFQCLLSAGPRAMCRLMLCYSLLMCHWESGKSCLLAHSVLTLCRSNLLFMVMASIAVNCLTGMSRDPKKPFHFWT